MFETSVRKLLTTYDAMPHMGVPLQSLAVQTLAATAPVASIQPSRLLLDMIDGKHALIVGSTGTGKSTLAQWIAGNIAHNIKVYDPDATPQEWKDLEVVGRGGDFKAIATAMEGDLAELERRCQLRGQKGDSALAGEDIVLIAEEFPALANEIDVASDWLGKVARRGRKPKMFIIALSQSDTVTALSIEGDGAIRSNFSYIRLGSHAVTHARKLKREDLVQWLQAGKYRALVDDEPCQLPDTKIPFQLAQVVPRTTLFTPKKQPEVPTEKGLNENNMSENITNPDMSRIARKLKADGVSDSKIIQEYLGYTGRRYQDGKEELRRLLGWDG